MLVAAAVLTGHFLFLARTRRQGIDTPVAAGMSFSAYACGFIGSHLLKLVYDPSVVLRGGWTAVFSIFSSMSSFGGLFGALAGMVLYFRLRKIDDATRWRMIDSGAFVFPFGWIFGRLGCTLVHDHPGSASMSWLAIAGRWDLGFLELLFDALVIVPLFLWLDRRPRRAGFYPGVFLSIYGLFRIALDQLHLDPPRYGGITVDQWAGAAAVLAGVWFLKMSTTRPMEAT